MTAAVLSDFERAVGELTRKGFPRPLAEAEVRRQLLGQVPSQQQLDAVADLDADAIEDDHVDEGVKLMRGLGFEHVSFSQRKRAKVTPGIPDHRFYHRRRKLFVWWEAKASAAVSHRANGGQSTVQRNYQEMCDACGDPYVLGGVDALREWLEAMGVAEFDASGLPHPIPPRR